MPAGRRLLAAIAGCATWIAVAGAPAAGEPRALYKAGSAQLARGDARAALDTLLKAATVTERRRLPVDEQAVYFFEVWKRIADASDRLGEPTQARRLFGQLDDPLAARTLENAAWRLQPQGNHEASTRAFRLLLRLVPDSPRACVWREGLAVNAGTVIEKSTCTTPEAVAYGEAMKAYKEGRFDRAAKMFQAIVDTGPGHPYAIEAAGMLIHALGEQQKVDEIALLVDRLLTKPRFADDTELGPALIEAKGLADVAQGIAFERQKKPAACAAAFLAAAERQPHHVKHAERLWNAAACFHVARQPEQALRAWAALAAAHPKDSLAAKALFESGGMYADLGDTAKAAEAYEEMARRFPKDERAVEARAAAKKLRAELRDRR